MNETLTLPYMFRNLEEILVGSHIFFPVVTINGEMLPCIHVLCRSCVETVSSRKGKKSEDRMTCAVCGLEFEIPYLEALHKRKPMAELLLELSKAANNVKPLCEKNQCSWNEVNSRLASAYCTVCKKHACFLCANKQHPNHQQSVEKRSHWIRNSPNLEFCRGHKWHFKQLEVFCIACWKADCFMRFFENLPYKIKVDFDKILSDEIQSLNELSKELCAIKTRVERQIQPESRKKDTERKIEAHYKELIEAEEKHKNWILYKLKTLNNQVMTEHETLIKAGYEGQIKAIESLRNSLLDQLKPVNTEVEEELEKKKGLIDALLKTVDSYIRSCAFLQARGEAEEKFCALGAIFKKVKELKTELSFWLEHENPKNPKESADLKKSFKAKFPLKTDARSLQGLSNFGNTSYFNAVIQCLCETFPLLEDLSSRNTSEQPLTEAFVKFLNYRYIDAHEQNTAFSEFFEQLCRSSPKFNNHQQHDSHDLFIRFLNDLRSEESLHITKDPRFNVDPRKVLTTVDKVFGGHFITMYACLKCTQPYFVCECFLDISLPMCFPTQQPYSGGGTGEAYQVSNQRDLRSTVHRRQQLIQTPCNDQGKEMMPAFLESLNEKRRYHPRLVALTECLTFFTATKHIPEGYLCLSCQDLDQAPAAVNAQTMPPAMKRTLIYNPPAILVLHMQCFERTTTGLTKRRDRVIYEELLDLGPYCSSDCLRVDPEDKNVWYSLYGVVVYSDSSEVGHYIANVKVGDSNPKVTKTFLQKSFLERDTVAIEQKNKLGSGGRRADRKLEWRPNPATDGKWICASDTNIRDATSHEALSQEAFMLFYERVSKHEQ